MRWFVLTPAVIGTLTAMAFAVGFSEFVAVSHRAAGTIPEADGIVALTGGPERIETALRLLAAGRGKVLLVSGVSRNTALPELLHRAGLEDGPIAARITLGRVATTTRGNADETREWVETQRIGSLIVVTAGFHMPRALLELRRAIPQIVLYPIPVPAVELGRFKSFRQLFAEYVKLIGAWLRITYAIR